MIIGTLLNGKKCVYDLPVMIKTAEQLESLIYGYNENPSHREELQGQPLLLALSGPMYNGMGMLKNQERKLLLSAMKKMLSGNKKCRCYL